MSGAAYQIREGDRVTGHYHGAEFTGTVYHRRWEDHRSSRLLLFHIRLDSPVAVYGIPRHVVHMAVDMQSGCGSNCALRLLTSDPDFDIRR